MKLLGKYEDIQNLKTAEENYGFKPGRHAEKSLTEIAEEIVLNNEKIAALEMRREKLSKQNEEADLRALGIDSKQAERLAEIKGGLERSNRRKSRLKSQLDAVRNNMPDNDGMLQKDFSVLLRFFPKADIDAFTDVEQFHAKINSFLRSDIEDEIARLIPLIEYIDADITMFEKQIADSGIARSRSRY